MISFSRLSTLFFLCLILSLPFSSIAQIAERDVTLTNETIELFHNPVEGLFTIEGLTADYYIQILDANYTVYQNYTNVGSRLSVDVSVIPDGMYFIHIKNKYNGKISLTKILHNMPSMHHDDYPYVDITQNMEPADGIGFVDVYDTDEEPDNTYPEGAFRIPCHPSHMSNNDPIVFPGQEGASHHHTFFGNTLTDHASDVANLSAAGNSTCAGGIMNRSAYWVPSMIDTMTNTPLEPESILVYYKTQRSDDVQRLPVGLRIISKPGQYGEYVRFQCNDGENDLNYKENEIIDCQPGHFLRYGLDFPNCWDGVNLDSEDHTTHMAFTAWDEVCPASHPVRLPNITFNVYYEVTTTTAHWRLASDKKGVTPGSTIHGDWINGWDEEFSNTFVDECLKAGKDCHGHLLGDGRAYDFNED